MSDINAREQWLLDGDCSICRRSRYCDKPCKAQRERSAYTLQNAVMRMMTNIMSGSGQKQRPVPDISEKGGNDDE